MSVEHPTQYKCHDEALRDDDRPRRVANDMQASHKDSIKQGSIHSGPALASGQQVANCIGEEEGKSVEER
jgi:hypothetical protein